MAALLSSDVNKLRKQISDCHSVLNSFKWLTDAFVLDYFTEDHWNRLPSSWAKVVDSLSPKESGQWILSPSDKSEQHNFVFPLSMLALKAFKQYKTVDRATLSNLDTVVNYLQEQKCNIEGTDNLFCDIENQGSAKTTHHVYQKHIKPKKWHELKRMGQICSVVSRASECDTVVDIGAGVGHLSRLLSFTHSLNLISLECNPNLSETAVKLDAEFEEKAAKLNGGWDGSKPRHVTAALSSDTNSLTELLRSQIDGEKMESYGIVGLHTCGDLGPTMIRQFAKLPEIRFILAIGCCYMKIDMNRPISSRGYPMSDYLNNLQPSFISYEALEVACHALESYCDRLRDSEAEKLKVHCFRATLETLLVGLNPPVRRAGLRSVKNAHLMSFEEYCTKALYKLENISLDPAEFSEPYSTHIQSCLAQWHRVVAFYSLRLLLAPIIETVLQLDRLLYLTEQGWSGCLLPLFDCRLSPRNCALLCVKPPPGSKQE